MPPSDATVKGPFSEGPRRIVQIAGLPSGSAIADSIAALDADGVVWVKWLKHESEEWIRLSPLPTYDEVPRHA